MTCMFTRLWIAMWAQAVGASVAATGKAHGTHPGTMVMRARWQPGPSEKRRDHTSKVEPKRPSNRWYVARGRTGSQGVGLRGLQSGHGSEGTATVEMSTVDFGFDVSDI